MIPSSPYDGLPRGCLRIGLAVVSAVTLVSAASEVTGARAGSWSHPIAPGFLLAFGGSIALVAPVVIAGLAALVHFARAPSRPVSAAIGLAATALLAESAAAIGEGPKRHLFASGAALLGWILGLVYARALSPRDGPPAPGVAAYDERLAEAGAVSALAATYVDAALSKLTTSGFTWTDGATLRGVILSQHRIDDGSIATSYAHAVAFHPAFAEALSAATIVIQGLSFLYVVGPRLRAIFAILLIGFHTNIEILTGIGYTQARVLILIFAFPWPRAWAWIRARFAPSRPPSPPAPEPVLTADPEHVRAVALRALAIVAITCALAWILPIHAYTSLHHNHQRAPAGARGR